MKVDRIFPEINIPTREVCFFQQMVSPVSLKKGEYFVAPDTSCDRIAFIESGMLRTVLANDERQFIISLHTKNQFVSVFTSFLTGEKSSLAIQALEATDLTVISDQLFFQLCQRHVCWTQFWLRVFGTRTSDLIEMERHLLGV